MSKAVSGIMKIVYAKYPVTEKEKTCAAEKRKQDYLREQYRKRLINPAVKEKREIV